MKNVFKTTLATTLAGVFTFGAGLTQAQDVTNELVQPTKPLVVPAEPTLAQIPEKDEIPVVLRNLRDAGGMQIHSSFEAASGLDGWVIQEGQSGKYVVVFTTPDGETMLAGLALDKNGNNLSKAYSDQYLPQPDYGLALEDFAHNSSNVVLGSADAPAEITVVFDANCIYCKTLHKLVNPAIEAGELRMRIVPVAILGADSGPKGAGLLVASDLKTAAHAVTYGLGQVQRSNDPTVLAKVRANTALMQKHGFGGTPVVIYETGADADGDSAVHVANGVPDVAEMFKRLGISGHLDKLSSDPSLARFLN